MKKIKKIKNLQRGYTLIELLAVMVVMTAVGIIVSAILVSSLRGTTKTTVLNNIRQSGSYPIIQMSKMIEFSKSFDGVSTDGLSYITDCTIAAVGATTPTPTPKQYQFVKISTFDNSTIIFSCEGNPLTIASNGASLINTEQVKVNSCSFSCTQNYVTQPPTIGIHFSLSKNVTSNFSEQDVTIPFDTTISVRNSSN
ncbi:type II secretion system GspH family protein [Patescibacteria group bacterium]|nr:type II secretion system GspH family protein [Patescibacteria group bacterium]